MGEVCTLTLDPRIQLFEEGVVDHAENRYLLVDQAKGDAYMGESMDEVCRAVCEIE